MFSIMISDIFRDLVYFTKKNSKNLRYSNCFERFYRELFFEEYNFRVMDRVVPFSGAMVMLTVSDGKPHVTIAIGIDSH